MGGFPDWATRHFGTTSKRFYLASHVVLVAAVTASVVLQVRRPQARSANLALGAIASSFVMNGFFHLETTARFGEPSPGLLSAKWLMIPGGVATLVRLLRDGAIDRDDLLLAVTGGVLLNAAAVGSLRLDMPSLGGVQ